MRCLETEEFPYYPTDNVWRREEFSKFIQYQANLWDEKIIKQTMHGLALLWSYMPHAFDVQCGKMNTPLQTFHNEHQRREAYKTTTKQDHAWFVLLFSHPID
jgi:hypothetical protein